MYNHENTKKGKLKKLRLSGIRFPSRHHTVIDHRDELFFERMQAELTRGVSLLSWVRRT